ncbi:MAG: YncE family protein [Endozoicomonas sp.]
MNNKIAMDVFGMFDGLLSIFGSPIRKLTACLLSTCLLLAGCGGGGGGGSEALPSDSDTAGEGNAGSGGSNEGNNLLPERRKADPNRTLSFESASIRPLVRSQDNKKLYAVNTPDNALLVFDIAADGQLTQAGSVNVGMEPVAVAVRPELTDGSDPQEVWVVNHLSDSISVVDTSSPVLYIKKTLLVGDEPRDIVFARDKAFITTARRGQQRLKVPESLGGGDPKLHEPSLPRADVWVFDAADTGTETGGMPVRIINLFGDTPRALAVSGNGDTVYAAIFNSGNRTSIVHETVLCRTFQDFSQGVYRDRPCNTLDGKQLPGGRTAPSTNKDGVVQPLTSMIVKYDEKDGKWKDSGGWDFSNGVRLNLPDRDVFAINAETLQETESYPGVGTTLYNMVVHPVNGNIYVSNTEANNSTRFEGPGDWLRREIERYRGFFPPYDRIKDTSTTVQGNIAQARITVIKPDGSVTPVHLNPHIDYSKLKRGNDKTRTLATPTQMEINSAGDRLFITAMGSDKVAVYDISQLDSGDADNAQSGARHIKVPGGPAGLLLAADRAYAVTRFDNSLVVLDTDSGNEIQRVAMHNPEPASVQAGRFMLYDANRSSSNGEASCASCHIFGDTDHLSWNLGNPDASNTWNPLDHDTLNLARLDCSVANGGILRRDGEVCNFLPVVNGSGDPNVRDFDGRTVADNLQQFAALKGPMATQTMRGMSTHGALHWRGDRSNGFFSEAGNINNERTSFRNFIVAFEGLLGLDVELGSPDNMAARARQLADDMDKFADFMLAVQLPPNPIRPLDNSLSPAARQGKDFFLGQAPGRARSDGLATDSTANDARFGDKPDGVSCEGCHTFEPEKGFFGADGKVAHGGEILILKVPHFRNLYTRVGMFGLPSREGFLPSTTNDLQNRDQIRGFGFLHDGATDTLFNFLKGGVFDDGANGCSTTDTGLNENLDARKHGCEFNFGNVGIPNDTVRQNLVEFLMESDSDLAPIVGQQITLNSNSSGADVDRVNLLIARSKAPFKSKLMNDVLNRGGGNLSLTECEMIAHGRVGNDMKSYLFADGHFTPDSSSEEAIPESSFLDVARESGNSLTFTCVPPGSGEQMALDRDLDGYLNRDEVRFGSDPVDAESLPQADAA